MLESQKLKTDDYHQLETWKSSREGIIHISSYDSLYQPTHVYMILIQTCTVYMEIKLVKDTAQTEEKGETGKLKGYSVVTLVRKDSIYIYVYF